MTIQNNSEADEYDLTAFEAEKRRRWASWLATAGTVVFYLVNAAGTFIYGFVSMLQRYPIDEDSSNLYYFSVMALAAGVGLALILLLDVARVFWQAAAIAERTNKWQQGIARGMEIYSLAASIVAAVIASRMILEMIGLGAPVDVARTQWLTTNLLTGTITLHISLSWLYNFLSPAARARRLASQSQAMALDSVAKHAHMAAEKAEASAKEALRDYMPHIVDEHAKGIVRTALTHLKYGQRHELPPVHGSQAQVVTMGATVGAPTLANAAAAEEEAKPDFLPGGGGA